MAKKLDILQAEAVDILSGLIRLPSFSRSEEQTAAYLEQYLLDKGVQATRVGNNVLAVNKFFDEKKPTILLNSHHDTVKPNSAYTKDPFSPQVQEGKLFGLGSNDAGGCLVSLLMAFLYYYNGPGLAYNLIFAATAEEEVSGANGIQLALQHLPAISFAIVGEPTLLEMAIAERGLVVLDAKAAGKAGHAAREEGENAIYNALQDLEWFRTYRFEKVSPFLGPVKMSVTSIETDNKTHNIVPAECRFVVDIRVNELYTLEEVVDAIRQHVRSEVTPRSLRLRSSLIPVEHPIVKAGMALGKSYYGSPTTSDKSLMPFPALKIGPGNSGRSHTADEFIFIDEIKEGIAFYIKLLGQVL